MTDRSKTVVLLIDWDNLQICHSRDAPGTELDLSAVIALAQSYGTLVSARAYAEWNLQTERMAVYKAGIEPVFAPVMRPESGTREGKSLADTVMVADGVDLLWTVAPDVFVLVTSDKDMIPLARIAKQRGAAVVILGSDLTAIPLIEISNVFITYRQLVRELDKTTELDAPSGRAAARERGRAHEARRPSTEPFGGRVATGQPSRGPSRPPLGGTETPPRPPAARPPARTVAADQAGAAPVAALPTPSGDGAEVDAAASAEGAARRRRRRGGRSRGRGGSGASTPELQEAQVTAGEGEMEAAEEPTADDRPPEMAPPAAEPVATAAPEAAPAERPRRGGRAPRPRPSPAPAPPAALVFSEFGPPTAASAGRPASESPARPADDPVERAESPALSQDLPGSAPEPEPLATSGPTDAASTEPSGPSLVSTPTGNGAADGATEPAATEERPKPVRRRRTRATTSGTPSS